VKDDGEGFEARYIDIDIDFGYVKSILFEYEDVSSFNS